MVAKIIEICLGLLLLLSLSCWASSDQPAKRVPYTPVQYLKNYALSSCLSYGLEAKDAKVEAGDAAGGYLELGSFGVDAYEEAAALARTFLAKPYQSIHGGKLTVMKCIDLFHSKELDQLARKYDKERKARLKKLEK